MKDLSILKPDTRDLYNKYNPDHTEKLQASVIENVPSDIDSISESIELIRNSMSDKGILMFVDSQISIFNAVWDNLPQTLKETVTNEPSDTTSGQTDEEL